MRGAAIEGSRNGAILSSIVGLAEALGMDTVAEGVETEAQRQFLLRLGVTMGQGFLFAPGLAPDEFALVPMSA